VATVYDAYDAANCPNRPGCVPLSAGLELAIKELDEQMVEWDGYL